MLRTKSIAASPMVLVLLAAFWLGSAFAALPGASDLVPLLTRALATTHWPTCQRHLCDAYCVVAARHNQLGLTEPLDIATRRFYDRPYQVLGGDRFATALSEAITDPKLARLPLIGAVDQFVDSTDALGNVEFLRRACAGMLSA